MLAGIVFRLTNFVNIDYKKLRSLKGFHSGERCFIIGNGPSLTAEDLELLKGEICFAANRIYYMYDRTSWRPTYYAISDGNIVRQIGEEAISRSEAQICFYPVEVGKYLKNKSEAVLFKIGNNDYNNFKFSDNIVRNIEEGCTVTYSMTQIAVYMGFKEIYYLGMDCGDFEKHFYQNSKDEKKGMSDAEIKMKMRAFEMVKKKCQDKKIKIMNVTRGGKLEIFERVPLEEVIQA